MARELLRFRSRGLRHPMPGSNATREDPAWVYEPFSHGCSKLSGYENGPGRHRVRGPQARPHRSIGNRFSLHRGTIPIASAWPPSCSSSSPVSRCDLLPGLIRL
jgi:hypothetical protein